MVGWGPGVKKLYRVPRKAAPPGTSQGSTGYVPRQHQEPRRTGIFGVFFFSILKTGCSKYGRGRTCPNSGAFHCFENQPLELEKMCDTGGSVDFLQLWTYREPLELEKMCDTGGSYVLLCLFCRLFTIVDL